MTDDESTIPSHAAFMIVLADVIREIDDWPHGELSAASFLERLQHQLAFSELRDYWDFPEATASAQTLYDELCEALNRLRKYRSQ